MEVEKVYQDAEGKWHIDYSSSHCMGLAIRVLWGQFLIYLVLLIPIIILSALAGFTVGKSLPEPKNTASPLDVKHEPINNNLKINDVHQLKID
ncbi:MAG: hypothetical protein AAGA16_22555 [Cyanobacteria bacterium P01_E01_bin.35]